MSNRKRREPSDGFNAANINKIVSDNGSVLKKRKLMQYNEETKTNYDRKLNIKIECLKSIGTTIEYKYNINRSNINEIKQYLTSKLLNDNDKKEILNDYYFYYRIDINHALTIKYGDYSISEEEARENEYRSLSEICRRNYSLTKQYDTNYNVLWVQLIHLFINHGMNIFLDYGTRINLHNAFIDQYIHKKTLQIEYIACSADIKSNEYYKLSLFSLNGEYKITIDAINKYSISIPPIISISISDRRHYWNNHRFSIDSKIIGESRWISNVSPNVLNIAIQRLLSSILVNISDIDMFEQHIAKQYEVKIRSIQETDDENNYGFYQRDNNKCIELSYLFIIKCFYEKYKKHLISELKDNDNVLPFDIINIIMNQYYFQNLSFLNKIKSFNKWFYIFFLNIHLLSENWQNWIYDNYLHEIDKMVMDIKVEHDMDDNNKNWNCPECTYLNIRENSQCPMCCRGKPANINDFKLLSANTAYHIVSCLHRCKLDKMAVYVLNLYRKYKLDSYEISRYILGNISFETRYEIKSGINTINKRLDIISKSVPNAWQIFESLFFRSLQRSNYWVMIILIKNNLINVKNYEIDQQLIEYDMGLDELDEMQLLHDMDIERDKGCFCIHCEVKDEMGCKCHQNRMHLIQALEARRNAKQLLTHLLFDST